MNWKYKKISFKKEKLLFIIRMGRIKSTFVKSSGKKIYEMGKAEFSENFDNNKGIVDKYAKIPSKRLKNSVVGFITRLVKKEERVE